MVSLGNVLQRRAFAFWRLELPGLPIDLEHVPEGILEPECRAMARVAVGPAKNPAARFVDRCHPPLQGLRRRHAIGDVADTRRVVPRELERMEFVVVKGAKIDAVLFSAALRQPEDANKEVEALLEPVGVEFHVAQMGNVMGRIQLESPCMRTHGAAALAIGCWNVRCDGIKPGAWRMIEKNRWSRIMPLRG